MTVEARLRELGGIASRATLLALVPRAELDASLASGLVVVEARGRYALPEVEGAVRIAHRHTGILALTSAALHHGWEVKTVPPLPHVTVPRKRNPPHAPDAVVHFRDLRPDEVTDGIATNVEVTLDQCLRLLPYDEALCVADSALRHGVPPQTLVRVAALAAGPGSVQARLVAGRANGDAANVFESCLRAICHEVPGLDVQPQVVVRTPRTRCRPDLVDRRLGLVLEADSFAWHGDRGALRRDARRYNLLVADGWIVLRFAWEDVMFDPGYVRDVLKTVVALVAGQAPSGCRCGGAA